MQKKKRKMSAAQKAALAKGRAALARKRKSGSKTTKRKTTTKKRATAKKKAATPKKKTTTRKTVAKRKTVKRSSSMAKKKSGVKGKARRAAGRARNFLRKSGAKGILMDAGTAVAGGIAAGFLVNKLPIADPRIKSAAPIIGGLALAMTIGKKNQIAKGIGTGMVVLGAVSVIKQMAPQVPMLAGESDYQLLPNYAALPYSGETVDLGYNDFDDDSLATMGETVDLGEDVYVSPASI